MGRGADIVGVTVAGAELGAAGAELLWAAGLVSSSPQAVVAITQAVMIRHSLTLSVCDLIGSSQERVDGEGAPRLSYRNIFFAFLQ